MFKFRSFSHIAISLAKKKSRVHIDVIWKCMSRLYLSTPPFSIRSPERMIDSLVSLSLSSIEFFCILFINICWKKFCRQLICVRMSIYRLDFALRLTVMIISQDETKSDRYSLACRLFFFFPSSLSTMSTSVNKQTKRKKNLRHQPMKIKWNEV